MFAMRSRRKTVTEKGILDFIAKVIQGCVKFNATATYFVYNIYPSKVAVGTVCDLYCKETLREVYV